MEKVTTIIGENIAALRKAKNMTQQQLAERINYSNKAVSRWENGECLPNVETLTEICELFGVEFEYLIKRHEEVKPGPSVRANKIALALLAIVTVFTIATVVFVYVKLFHAINIWQIFVWGVPASSIIIFYFVNRWKTGKTAQIVSSSVSLWSILASLYLTFITQNVWSIFLVGIPVQIMIVLFVYVSKGGR